MEQGDVFGNSQKRHRSNEVFMSLGATDWERGLCEAIKTGRKYFVEYFVEKGGVSLREGLHEACTLGNKMFVDYLIDKISVSTNHHIWYWNGGLCGASKGGHRDLAELFCDKGADDLDKALVAASRGGHKELVEWLLAKGARDCEHAMTWAIRGSHKELVTFFAKRTDINMNQTLLVAACHAPRSSGSAWCQNGPNHCACYITDDSCFNKYVNVRALQTAVKKSK